MSEKHSPTPWKAVTGLNEVFSCDGVTIAVLDRSVEGPPISDKSEAIDMADRDLIIRVVNAYTDMESEIAKLAPSPPPQIEAERLQAISETLLAACDLAVKALRRHTIQCSNPPRDMIKAEKAIEDAPATAGAE